MPLTLPCATPDAPPELPRIQSEQHDTKMKYLVVAVIIGASLAAAGRIQPAQHPQKDTHVTAAPTATSIKHANITPVSDCESFEDPDDNGPSGCQCSGYTGLLPMLPGTASCGYTAVTAGNVSPRTATWTTPVQTTGAVSGFPFTTTMSNKAIVAYESSTMSNNIGFLTGSSTTVTSGTNLNIQQDPTAGVNAGTLSGNPLYSAISSSLDAACPTPSGSVNSCNNVSSIDNISYLDGDHVLQTDGELVIALPIVQYSSPTARQFMIESIAAMVNATTLNSSNANTVTPEDPNAGNPYGITPSHDPPITFYNAPAVILTEFTDAGVNQDEQKMLFQMSLEQPNQGGGYGCAMGALALDAIGVIALIPGLDWLTFVDAPVAAGLSATCLAIDVAQEQAGGD